jgi:uncharacterized protein
MLGTIINAGTILLGSSIGLLLHSRMPKRINKIVFQVIGLFTMFLGVYMALKTNNFLILIFSVLIGGIIGEGLDLEAHINKSAEKLKGKIKARHDNFSEGLVTAFIVFCVGSLAILGAFEEGLEGNRHLLLVKSLLDGFTSIALASAYGSGVAFSVVPLIIYQGGLTLLASYLRNVLSTPVIAEMSSAGGLLLLGLGLSLLDIKKINVVNMLPALLVAIILTYFAIQFNIYKIL